MKNTLLNWLTVCCLAVSSMVLTTGCGQEEDTKSEDGKTPPSNTPPSTTPTTNVDPVRVTGSRTLSLSTRFVNNASEAELRGTFPGITWTGGTLIGAASNGYFSGQQLNANAVGSFSFSYLALPNTWADYGTEANLRGMTPEGRAFVQCNWWTGSAKVAVSSGECHLQVAVAADGTVTAAGNMRSFQ